MLTATYSPDDNKLRLYSLYRLDKKTYERVRAAGFIWAAKQELFVAPKWTPEREDLLIDLCGEIGDEDKSLIDRAEERADRFEEYSEKRADEAERAQKSVSAITDNIPLGQPILVGHHSERHARRDQEKIENGMRRAVNLWKTSKYWTGRAAGALRHAKYKERADVRARRIKTLEAEKRGFERRKAKATFALKFWRGELKRKEEHGGGFIPVDHRYARWFTGSYDHVSQDFPLDKYPRSEKASQYEGSQSLWGALGDTPEQAIITPEQATAIAVPIHEANIAYCDRFIDHLDNRLTYERAMLGEQGATHLLAPKPKSKAAQLPLLNYRSKKPIMVQSKYHREPIPYSQVEMTKAEYTRINRDYKNTQVVENSHRIRTAMVKMSLVAVFLTDSKVHKKPAPVKPEPATQITRGPAPITIGSGKPKSDQDQRFENIEQSLKQGVQVVTAPQLFPTPAHIADQMVALAGIQPGHQVLEPSAGTGRIIDAIRRSYKSSFGQGSVITAVEINVDLASQLRSVKSVDDVRQTDFLSCNGDLGKYDRIIMNPPFENGADIKHILHARHFLKPGGRIVALCAAGPRQEKELKPIASTWERLPADSFKESGTGVGVVMLTIE